MNSAKIIDILFKELNIKYTSLFVKKFLKTQAQLNSPTTIIKLLEEYKIESILVQFSSTQLREAEFPMIIVLDLGNKNITYALLFELKDDHIKYILETGGIIQETIVSFIEKWSGVAILIDAQNQEPEREYEFNKKLERKKKLQLVFLLLSLIIISSSITWGSFNSDEPTILLSLIVLKICGLYVTINLIKESIGIQTVLSEKICKASSFTDCQKVVNSTGNRFIGISLSDLGFLYFAVTFSFVILSSYNNSFWPYIYVAAILTLPFTIFSVFYQWRILKLWCPLCLIVNLLFLFEFIVLFQKNFINPELPSMNHIINGLGIISSIVCLFYIIKKEWLLGQRFYSLQKRFHSFKNNEKIVNIIIENGEPIKDTQSLNQMEIGNLYAENELIAIIGPTCKPCSIIHFELDRLYQYFENHLSIKIIPTFSVHDELSKKVSENMVDILSSNIFEKREIINSWFQIPVKNEVSFEKWKGSFKVVSNPKVSDEITSWIEINKIDYTPCFILNRKIVYFEYDLKDIKRYLKSKLRG
jgi:uncharacterized membrane protein